jgi:hypothetical protein
MIHLTYSRRGRGRRAMKERRILWVVGSLCLLVALLLVACGGGNTSAMQESSNVTEKTGPENDGFPSNLVIHPEATNVQMNPASGTYIYVVPGMVAETLEFLETEMKAKGWEELGRPTIMGHLATLNMTLERSRVTISMQDNEISQTTRVQMLLLEQ